jgi:hypothetical protein
MKSTSKFYKSSNENESNENSYINQTIQTLPSINNNNNTNNNNNILNTESTNKNTSRNINVTFSQEDSDKSFDKIFMTSKNKSPKNNNNFHPYNKNIRHYVLKTKEEIKNEEKIKQKKELNLKKKLFKNLSNKQRERFILDKLYGLTPSYKEKYEKVKKRKNLSLEEYQNHILSFFSNNTDINKMVFMDLKQNFEEIKENNDSICVLPPINVDNIIYHVKNSVKEKKSDKMMSIRDYLNKNEKEKNRKKDDFEIEEEQIKQMKKYKIIPKKKRNKNLDVLPSHLRDLLQKQLKFNV